MSDDIQGLRRIEKLQQLNSANAEWVNRDLYRILCREDVLIAAYESIKSKPGNMTPGITGATLDGTSLATIRKTVESLRNESFQFSPAKRVEIPKKNGKTRPLGIAPPNEKIVQKGLEMILMAIYEPQFSESSHGFRPGRGCHSALKEVERNWTNITWVVEGDIKGFFDNIDHQKLIDILRRKIADERFLNLIWKALRAGYLHHESDPNGRPLGRTFHKTPKGTPQGSIVSPILANIYLHEFDLEVERWQKELESEGKTAARNPVARQIEYECRKRRAWLDGKDSLPEGMTREEAVNELRDLQKRRLDTRYYLDGWIRVKYVRYADDWMIGIIGPKSLAEELKLRATKWLSSELKLELSDEKTLITHTRTGSARFLGTLVKTHKGYIRRTEIHGRKVTRREGVGKIHMIAPIPELIRKLADKGFCTKSDHAPKAKAEWLSFEEWEIVHRYNAVLRGLLNYYSFVDNRSRFHKIAYILQFSLAHTLARRRKCSIKSVFKAGRGQLIAHRMTSEGRKAVIFQKPKSLKVTGKFLTGTPGLTPETWVKYFNMRSKSKLGKLCVICGSNDRVQMHHVRHIRKMGETVTGVKRVMASINRKQIPVCHECHWHIHRGNYDSLPLAWYADLEAAK